MHTCFYYQYYYGKHIDCCALICYIVNSVQCYLYFFANASKPSGGVPSC
jgi:hypothetical protein